MVEYTSYIFRTIIWLQTSRDAAVERARTPGSRRDDQHEFSIGRLKHERIRISRDDKVEKLFVIDSQILYIDDNTICYIFGYFKS